MMLWQKRNNGAETRLGGKGKQEEGAHCPLIDFLLSFPPSSETALPDADSASIQPVGNVSCANHSRFSLLM